jgi:hypothetical protein
MRRFSCKVIFCQTFLKKWNLSTTFSKNAQYQISFRSIRWKPSCSTWTDTHGDAYSRFSEFLCKRQQQVTVYRRLLTDPTLWPIPFVSPGGAKRWFPRLSFYVPQDDGLTALKTTATILVILLHQERQHSGPEWLWVGRTLYEELRTPPQQCALTEMLI